MTHILVGELKPTGLCIQHPSAAAVSTQWLVQCLKEQKRVDHRKHLVHSGQGQPLPCLSLDPHTLGLHVRLPVWSDTPSALHATNTTNLASYTLCLDHRPCVAPRKTMAGCRAGGAPGNESETESLASPSLGSPSKSLRKFEAWLGHWSPELDSITSTTTLVLQVAALTPLYQPRPTSLALPGEAAT